jgi:hypothetical protein
VPEPANTDIGFNEIKRIQIDLTLTWHYWLTPLSKHSAAVTVA